jgi:hypothetical protein
VRVFRCFRPWTEGQGAVGVGGGPRRAAATRQFAPQAVGPGLVGRREDLRSRVSGEVTRTGPRLASCSNGALSVLEVIVIPLRVYAAETIFQ